MKMPPAVAALAAVFALAAPGVQAGDGARSASTSIGIRGFVPIICRVQMNIGFGVAGEDGVVPLGQANEFCNSGSGYRVTMTHPANLQNAAVIVDGLRVPLSPSGATVVSDVHHAAIRNVQLAIDPGDNPEQLQFMGIQIQPR